ncbi:MAG: hypothetical protein MUC66_00100 [Methanolinea sp.]|jgi:hypothetical protein|nr:hypothetical protein [Methanolinea sp.]
MRRDILILIIAVIIIAACGIVLYPFLYGPASASITSVTTDKDLYHSKEIMKIAVSIRSQGDMGNASLRLLGIQDRYGDFQLHQEVPVNLSPGPHTLVYDHQLPTCSSCSGLAAGTYQIEVLLIQKGIVISNMTHSLQIEQ